MTNFIKNIINGLFSLILNIASWTLRQLWAMVKSPAFWKLVVLVVMASSVYGMYYFAKITYNFHCSAGGYFVTKADCETFANAEFLENENSRLERVIEMMKDKDSMLSLDQ